MSLSYRNCRTMSRCCRCKLRTDSKVLRKDIHSQFVSQRLKINCELLVREVWAHWLDYCPCLYCKRCRITFVEEGKTTHSNTYQCSNRTSKQTDTVHRRSDIAAIQGNPRAIQHRGIESIFFNEILYCQEPRTCQQCRSSTLPIPQTHTQTVHRLLENTMALVLFVWCTGERLVYRVFGQCAIEVYHLHCCHYPREWFNRHSK